MTSARDLSAHLAELLHRERAALGEFLVALADFDRNRLWVELGHASLFYFLHRELGLSSGAAFYRKTAAELIQRFPEIVDPLRDGRLCMTSVVELRRSSRPRTVTRSCRGSSICPSPARRRSPPRSASPRPQRRTPSHFIQMKLRVPTRSRSRLRPSRPRRRAQRSSRSRRT